MSRDLKRRGFKFMGSITVYSHLQSCGIINDHLPGCFRWEEGLGNCVWAEHDDELPADQEVTP